MFKKTVLAITVLLLACAGNTFAVEVDSFYMFLTDDTQTGGNYNLLNRDGTPVYNINENPALFMHIPEDSLFQASFWTEPVNSKKYFGAPIDLGFNNYLLIPNWAAITKVQDLQWTAEGMYTQNAAPYETFSQTRNFSFVPEPISTALFLLGSGVLGAHTLRKKRKSA